MGIVKIQDLGGENFSALFLLIFPELCVLITVLICI
jgi:hypothetical protein